MKRIFVIFDVSFFLYWYLKKPSVWGRRNVLERLNMQGEPPPNVREVGRVAKKKKKEKQNTQKLDKEQKKSEMCKHKIIINIM